MKTAFVSLVALLASSFFLQPQKGKSGAGTPGGSTVTAALPPGVSETYPSGMSINVGITPGDPDGTGHNDGTIAAVHKAGFRWIRLGMEWNSVEKTAGVYTFDDKDDSKNYDLWVSEANKYGVGVMFNLRGKNKLYAGAAGDKPYDEAGRENFSNFAAAAAKHFKNKKVMFEAFNEPNTNKVWPMSADPKREPNIPERLQGADEYAALVNLTLPKMRDPEKGDPHVYVIGPAFLPNAGGRVKTTAWVKEVRAKGALAKFNAISIHFYQTGENQEPESVPADIAYWRDILSNPQYPGPPVAASVPILSGEWGYPVVKGTASVHPVSELDRARYLIRSYLALSSAPEKVVFHNWFDWHSPNAPFRIQGTLAESAATILSSTLNGYSLAHIRNSGKDHRLVFSKGAKEIDVVWTTSDSSSCTLTDLPAGSWKSVDGLSGEVATFSVAKAGYSMKLTGTPIYLIQQ